jgi:hypothetical protein
MTDWEEKLLRHELSNLHEEYAYWVNFEMLHHLKFDGEAWKIVKGYQRDLMFRIQEAKVAWVTRK